MSSAGLFKYFNRAGAGGGKRVASGNTGTPNTAQKKQKTRQLATMASSRLSMDQQKKIQENKKKAMLKLQQKRQLSASPSAAGPSFQLTLDGLEPGWQKLLKPEANRDYFKSMKSFLGKETAHHRVYPPANEIFAAFTSCPFDKVRVVIIGQDPYHGSGQAHGLCFSVKKGIKTPPSLRNIYKELHNDVGTPLRPSHGCLSKWCDQGVFLLNTSLTVRANKANSHSKCGWAKFTDRVVRVLNREKEGLVFLLWGKHAEKSAECVNRKKHHVFTSSHPSPLGATKTKSPFIGSRCFSKANKILTKQGGQPINWNV